MPVPVIALAYLVPGLMAAGATAYEWLKPARDPEWADKTVFNDRMRTLQANIQDMNTALSQCKSFMGNAAELRAWRNFKTNWSKFYADVGKLEYFDANTAQTSNAKLYTSQLVHWVDVLKTHKECVTPTTGPGAIPEPDPPPSDTPEWLLPAVAGLALGLYFLGKKP